MHEVARVLISLQQPPALKQTPFPTKTLDYAQFVIDKGQNQNAKGQEEEEEQKSDVDSSDARWFVRFGEVISEQHSLNQ